MSAHMIEIHETTVVESADPEFELGQLLFVADCLCGWAVIEDDLAYAQMKSQEHRVDVVDPHHITLHQGKAFASDYSFEGQQRWLCTCSCGWTVTRQIRSAAVNQADKHRKEQA